MNRVFLEIGGNQGDRLANIMQVKRLINGRIGTVIQQSSVYETPPWGFESTQWFYNQVLLVETSLSAIGVLSVLLLIEKDMGRIRHEQKYCSRTMDIDILFFNKQIIDTPKLQVPHPRIQERNFVLLPMAEIAPDHVHPILNKSILKLLSICSDVSECKVLKG